jgi:spermidine/putrescine transport system ATP-binding protein
MSDVISIMREGRIVQTASPRELYDAPVNRYVADFVGESNFFTGELMKTGEADITLRTAAGLVLSAPRLPQTQASGAEGHWVVAVRPEEIGIRAEASGRRESRADEWDVTLAGRVVNRIYLGDQTEFSVMTERLGQILVRAPKNAAATVALSAGDPVEIGWRGQASLALVDG